VAKEQLGFSSAHFISYEGDKCERLHGHNYRVAVELEGELDENRYVFDFIALKDLISGITAELDHRMLLPSGNRLIQVEQRQSSVQVTYRDRQWQFPLDDCVILPIENTTAELLARYIAKKLLETLKQIHNFDPTGLKVEVEETAGQSATIEVK
jgi:6-pyruvoyltetrahydropterin/6-carboxytetrahydropterin synthase